jgi:dihydrofolate reductase
MIILIAAVGENNALGKNNDLLWHLPDDFKRFKALTTGHPIIMGRKTFESLPKLLPNRKHIIITKQKNYTKEECTIVNSLKDALLEVPSNQDAYVIGGGEIYQQAIAIAHKLEITKVHHTFDADVFFPEIKMEEWNLELEAFHSKDEKHLYDYTFQTFVRKNEFLS